MPLNQPIQKRYFSISEVAKMLDVKPSLLRFWEKEFKQIQPKTNAAASALTSRKTSTSFGASTNWSRCRD